MTFESELIGWIDEHGKSPVPVQRNTQLFDDGVLDSILLTDLLLFVESTLGRPLTVDDLEPAAFRSVAAIAAHVSQVGS